MNAAAQNAFRLSNARVGQLVFVEVCLHRGLRVAVLVLLDVLLCAG